MKFGDFINRISFEKYCSGLVEDVVNVCLLVFKEDSFGSWYVCGVVNYSLWYEWLGRMLF